VLGSNDESNVLFGEFAKYFREKRILMRDIFKIEGF